MFEPNEKQMKVIELAAQMPLGEWYEVRCAIERAFDRKAKEEERKITVKKEKIIYFFQNR